MCWQHTMSAAQPRPARRRVLHPRVRWGRSMPWFSKLHAIGIGRANRQAPGHTGRRRCSARSCQSRSRHGKMLRSAGLPQDPWTAIASGDCFLTGLNPPDVRRLLIQLITVHARCIGRTTPMSLRTVAGRENVTRPMQFDIFMRIECRVAAESSGQRPPPPPDCHSSRRTALIVRMDAF
jgi:hypothetical protein